MKKDQLYPGVKEAERERSRTTWTPEPPAEFVGNAPNYEAFPHWDPERVMRWLNVD